MGVVNPEEEYFIGRRTESTTLLPRSISGRWCGKVELPQVHGVIEASECDRAEEDDAHVLASGPVPTPTCHKAMAQWQEGTMAAFWRGRTSTGLMLNANDLLGYGPAA